MENVIRFNYTMKFALLGLVIAVCSSCFKDDEPVVLPAPGNLENFQIGLGKTYHRQVYFDLGTKDTLGSEHSVWDLCFESSADGWHIYINGGNLALATKTGT